MCREARPFSAEIRPVGRLCRGEQLTPGTRKHRLLYFLPVGHLSTPLPFPPHAGEQMTKLPKKIVFEEDILKT